MCTVLTTPDVFLSHANDLLGIDVDKPNRHPRMYVRHSSWMQTETSTQFWLLEGERAGPPSN